jgi:hypothetical protein
VSPFGYVQNPKWSSNLHWVGVVIIEIWINSPQFFGASVDEFKLSLAVVNQYATQSHLPGVISAAQLGIWYSSSALDISYESKDD